MGLAIAGLAVQILSLVGNTGTQIFQLIAIREMLDNITNGAWLLEQARKWGFYFDKILINYSDLVYGYFQKIVGGTLISSELIGELMSNVQVIVGIFIVFKLSIISIKYMVNPEQFLDDKLGAHTLVKRVVFGSILIIFMPVIFNIANSLQIYVIKDRVIEKVILPRDAYLSIIGSNSGRDLAMMVFRGFFTWNSSISSSSEPAVSDAYNKVQTYNDIKLFSETMINEKYGNKYVISYVPIISTLAVGCLLVMLLKFSLEVLFRSFKLLFLRLLSPFVIVNYMLDPSQEESFKKWLNITISTYLLIFIRTFTLWFGSLICFYLANGIGDRSLLNDPDQLLKALIILGLFAFLKDLPKVVSEIFGYNLQENETISGLMNQAVGAVKGFALGKVGVGFSKDILNKNVGYSIASAGFNAVGTAGTAMVGISARKINGFEATGNIMGSVGSGLGNTMAGYTSGLAHTMSSAMGSSVLAPIAQSGNIAASGVVKGDYNYEVDRLKRSKKKPDDEDNKDEKGKQEVNVEQTQMVNNNAEVKAISENSTSVVGYQNHFADFANSFVKEGDTVDLTNSVSNEVENNNDISGSTINVNPVVQKMSDKVNSELVSAGYDTIGARGLIDESMRSYINTADFDVKRATSVDMTSIMTGVYESVSKAISDAKLDVSRTLSKNPVIDLDNDAISSEKI